MSLTHPPRMHNRRVDRASHMAGDDFYFSCPRARIGQGRRARTTVGRAERAGREDEVPSDRRSSPTGARASTETAVVIYGEQRRGPTENMINLSRMASDAIFDTAGRKEHVPCRRGWDEGVGPPWSVLLVGCVFKPLASTVVS